ncbi:hypothetical protein MLD38_016624 [Melastoma candidum]|nr:hypothetical protein MLD38_016624 [Melastoma candidum]
MDFMRERDEGFGDADGFVVSHSQVINKQEEVAADPRVSPSWLSCSPALPSGSEREDDSDKLDPMESSTREVEPAEPRQDPTPVVKEHMFDKVVTPSDVGKLNRLVIPKQHAEKYFPLDSSANEKGLLLNFEDRHGKPWRFRYSYWNSSQSYVMTKGWSRFVKEKKLDAGDIVSFQRGVGDAGKNRLFIDWRRRPDVPPPGLVPGGFPVLPGHFAFHRATAVPWSPLILRPGGPRDHLQLNGMNYGSYWHRYGGGGGGTSSGVGGDGCGYGYGSIVNLNHCGGLNSVYYISPRQMPGAIGSTGADSAGNQGGNEEQAVVFNSVPVVQGKAAAKRLRLFGVNMECPLSESNEHDVVLPSTSVSHVQNHHHHHHHHNQPQQVHHHRQAVASPGLQLPPLLRLYDGNPALRQPPQPSTSMPSADFSNKGKASSSMSLDLDI